MLRIFEKQTPELIEGLERSRRDGDFAQLQRIAHKLKSSVALLGLDYTHGLLASLESEASSPTDADVIYSLAETAVAACRDDLEAVRKARVEHERNE